MTDLTKITTPFGLLDEATQKALQKHFDAGGGVEYFKGSSWEPARMIDPPALTYRAAPLPPVTADDLAEALRAASNAGAFWGEHGSAKARALLARYDAQKGSVR